jgi:predicted transcriptional regulator
VAKAKKERSKVNKPIRKVTSFRLDVDLMRQVQHYAIDHDATITEVLEQALRDVLKRGDRK